MIKALKSFVRELTPPILIRVLRPLLRHLHPSPEQEEPWGWRPKEWYDKAFESLPEYRKHYSESVYYFLWTVVVDRILLSGVNNVLDLGCGPGQFASFLRDKGLKRYRGVDFSAEAVRLAREQCPSFEFCAADLSESNLLLTFDYDCVVALEFLEHVQDDEKILAQIKSGVKFYATVPGFPYVSHVRHFRDEAEVRSRYQRHFSAFRVDIFVENPQGKKYYLMEGTKL